MVTPFPNMVSFSQIRDPGVWTLTVCRFKLVCAVLVFPALRIALFRFGTPRPPPFAYIVYIQLTRLTTCILFVVHIIFLLLDGRNPQNQNVRIVIGPFHSMASHRGRRANPNPFSGIRCERAPDSAGQPPYPTCNLLVSGPFFVQVWPSTGGIPYATVAAGIFGVACCLIEVGEQYIGRQTNFRTTQHVHQDDCAPGPTSLQYLTNLLICNSYGPSWPSWE